MRAAYTELMGYTSGAGLIDRTPAEARLTLHFREISPAAKLVTLEVRQTETVAELKARLNASAIVVAARRLPDDATVFSSCMGGETAIRFIPAPVSATLPVAAASGAGADTK